MCVVGSAKKHDSPVLRSHGYLRPVLRGGEDRNENLPGVLEGPISRISGPISKSRSRGSWTGSINEAIKAVSEAGKRAEKAEKRAAKRVDEAVRNSAEAVRNSAERVDEAVRNERIAMNKLDSARSEAAVQIEICHVQVLLHLIQTHVNPQAARYTLKSESHKVLISKNSLNIRGALGKELIYCNQSA